jgi:hypothetical protein
MPSFAADFVPQVMGQMLLTVAPQYNGMRVIEPQMKHDFSAMRTKTVQMNAINRWPQNGMTKTQRRRNKLSFIGTANSEGLTSRTVNMEIFELTGPSTASGDPSSLWMTMEDILYSRFNLFQDGVAGFHEAIGSRNLADDYNGTMDRISILEVMNTTIKLNPANKADASTLITDQALSRDLDRATFNMQTRNTPVFGDGLYHALVDLTYLSHLMQDTDFKQSAFALQGNAQVPVAQPMGQALLPSMFRTAMSGAQVPGGMPGPGQAVSGILPILYKNILLFPSNNIPKRVVNSLDASLCLVFGPGSVAYGSGGKGVTLKRHNDTDYDRHMRYIWSHWCDMVYQLDDSVNSGAAVELRSFGAV